MFSSSDTAGEKDFEEFFTSSEVLDNKRFKSLGVIKNQPVFDSHKLDLFKSEISRFKLSHPWEKVKIVNLFRKVIPEFLHKETGIYLDGKM